MGPGLAVPYDRSLWWLKATGMVEVVSANWTIGDLRRYPGEIQLFGAKANGKGDSRKWFHVASNSFCATTIFASHASPRTYF